jgi:4-O-beta-D-mannosyl-D-glucose phosphorylase
MIDFNKRLQELQETHAAFIAVPNEKITQSNGVYNRYKNPVLTAEHSPLNWRYDFNPQCSI